MRYNLDFKKKRFWESFCRFLLLKAGRPEAIAVNFPLMDEMAKQIVRSSICLDSHTEKCVIGATIESIWEGANYSYRRF
jgi:hypothetical protein